MGSTVREYRGKYSLNALPIRVSRVDLLLCKEQSVSLTILDAVRDLGSLEPYFLFCVFNVHPAPRLRANQPFASPLAEV